MSTVNGALDRFAEEVGRADPVCVAGGRTHWDVGGVPTGGTREIRAPAGVVAHEPAEMIVRVRAGTTITELQSALAQAGQHATLEAEHPGTATVGGVLATGRSGLRRLGFGPVRNPVLEVTYVSTDGELIRSGAPLVKNVTGFDLCRLLVGSLGTLGFLAEIVLRCVPRPEVERWWLGEVGDPFSLARSLFRPQSILWDGTRTWVCLAGFAVDVDDQQRSVLGPRFETVDGPPALPGPYRRSRTPGSLRALPEEVGGAGDWLAEVGVGVVHCSSEAARAIPAPPSPPEAVAALHRELKKRFDPSGRLNPGRSVLALAAS